MRVLGEKFTRGARAMLREMRQLEREADPQRVGLWNHLAALTEETGVPAMSLDLPDPVETPSPIKRRRRSKPNPAAWAGTGHCAALGHF